ncbi:MAG: asparagine synthase (glutamine-hydrolyzing) [Polyangiales bacterium]
MCGIAGILRTNGRALPDLARDVEAMTDALVHRGPDGRGVFVDVEAGVALGHRRLAIVDLSPTGRQPMESADGRWILVFNGEIYNYRALRRELEGEGAVFRGPSDTEVLLECCARWGVGRTLRRLDGMFAFAAYDRRERELVLARDHVGIKPLYVARADGAFLFGSELKALFACSWFSPSLDPEAVGSFLRFGYVPAPRSILREVEKLLPGTFLTIDARGTRRSETYYSLRDVARRGVDARQGGGLAEAADELDRLLRGSVGRQMVADVPLGAFLSGGIDSSTVVALMQAQSSRPVRTFTIGFADREFDEADHARAIAKHLGTDHTELRLEPEAALAVVPELATIYDEPFADSSQIPTLLVSRMARQHVTVALSGDGGDELFAGYTRHFRGRLLAPVLEHVPKGARTVVARALARIPDRAYLEALRLLPPAARPKHLVERVHKVEQALASRDTRDLYRSIVAAWSDPRAILRRGHDPLDVPRVDDLDRELPSYLERMQFLDSSVYLPDDILCKVDRATMAASLESRVPILAPDVIAFAWTLPREAKVSGGRGKRVLRQVLGRYVPVELFERPKMGFAIPVGAWLRGPLREWAESLVARERLESQGLFDAEAVRAVFDAHVRGDAERTTALWAVLMLEAWIDRWGGRVRV